MNIRSFFAFAAMILLLGTYSLQNDVLPGDAWDISALPSSVRLDPVSNKIIDDQYYSSNFSRGEGRNLLNSNWIYDENEVKLHGARGEYISFQVVITNYSDSTLSDIKIGLENFKQEEKEINIAPELFLEWSVEVKNKSTGYPKTSLGRRWYPDALIPLEEIQLDSSHVHRWTYPLWLPDFNNRIDDQKSLVIWVDQYIPLEKVAAMPGKYRSQVKVSVGDKVKYIPVELEVWNFEIPNQNSFGASLQQEGFVSKKSEEGSLEVYQLLKKNRISVMDPTYKPDLSVSDGGEVEINWKQFDSRLEKYFSGEAFTKKYGYEYGPGYGEPIENFVLPFDVYGKHGTSGWPDIGEPNVEQEPENISTYIETIKQVRTHLNTMVDSEKTDLTVYLNGLDESYFKEAWHRMVYFGDLFKKFYPEAHFRIDGAYSKEAMDFVKNSIDYWGAHTINFNIEEVEQYHKGGIKSWLYGPMVYENSVNSWVGSSTFIDLPLINDRAISWSCWKYDIHSWISWGIGAGWDHAWYDPETWKDAYKAGSGSDPNFPFKKLNGNGMLIYNGDIVPNVDDPCPSIRLKTVRDGIQEYEYFRLLSQIDGATERVDSIIDQIINQPFGTNAIGVIDVWDYDARKWDEARVEIGAMIHESISN